MLPRLSIHQYVLCTRRLPHFPSRNFIQVIFMLPITHFAHTAAVSHHDESKAYCDKEVLIITGPPKGWRGRIRIVERDTCIVERGVSIGTYAKNILVVR